MITVKDYFMGRDEKYPDDLTDEIKKNAEETVRRVNLVLEAAKKAGVVASGWRPPAVNDSTSNAAKKSNHLLALACDLRDVSGELDKWCVENQAKLVEFGLWMEHPDATPGWCHLQQVPPRSGNRIFRP